VEFMAEMVGKRSDLVGPDRPLAEATASRVRDEMANATVIRVRIGRTEPHLDSARALGRWRDSRALSARAARKWHI